MDTTLTTTLLPPVVTVLPGNPETDDNSKTWIEDNPLLTSVIVISLLIAIAFLYFFWTRIKRRNIQKLEEVEKNGSEDHAASTVPSSSSLKNDAVENPVFIIRTHENPRRQSTNHLRPGSRTSRKSTLALPPAYVVKSQRKSAPSRPGGTEPKPMTVGWARWSTAGLEVLNTSSQQSQPATGENVNNKSTAPPAGFVLSVPTVYRRISYGQNHAIYAPEPASAHPEFLINTTHTMQRNV